MRPPTWEGIVAYLVDEFSARREDEMVICEVLLELDDGSEASQFVRVWQDADDDTTIAIDSPLRAEATIDEPELLRWSSSLRFGAIASEVGHVVVRHRAWIDGLTPELLDRCVFGVALDSFQLSEACVGVEAPSPDGTNDAFGHLCT